MKTAIIAVSRDGLNVANRLLDLYPQAAIYAPLRLLTDAVNYAQARNNSLPSVGREHENSSPFEVKEHENSSPFEVKEHENSSPFEVKEHEFSLPLRGERTRILPPP